MSFYAKIMSLYYLIIQYANAAADQAIDESRINLEKIDKDRAGVYIGSGAGGLSTVLDNYQTMLHKGAKRVSPFMLPASITNMASGLTAIKTGFMGPSFRSEELRVGEGGKSSCRCYDKLS